METVLGSQTPLQSCFSQSQKHELYLMYVLFFILTYKSEKNSFLYGFRKRVPFTLPNTTARKD